MNLTPLQIIGIILAVNGALAGATAQLTDLFGPAWAHAIVSASSLGSAILGGIVASISGQGSQIRNVIAMGGRIQATENATPALAQAAVDPAQPMVGATTPAVRAVLQDIAKSA